MADVAALSQDFNVIKKSLNRTILERTIIYG